MYYRASSMEWVIIHSWRVCDYRASSIEWVSQASIQDQRWLAGSRQVYLSARFRWFHCDSEPCNGHPNII